MRSAGDDNISADDSRLFFIVCVPVLPTSLLRCVVDLHEQTKRIGHAESRVRAGTK